MAWTSQELPGKNIDFTCLPVSPAPMHTWFMVSFTTLQYSCIITPLRQHELVWCPQAESDRADVSECQSVRVTIPLSETMSKAVCSHCCTWSDSGSTELKLSPNVQMCHGLSTRIHTLLRKSVTLLFAGYAFITSCNINNCEYK